MRITNPKNILSFFYYFSVRKSGFELSYFFTVLLLTYSSVFAVKEPPTVKEPSTNDQAIFIYPRVKEKYPELRELPREMPRRVDVSQHGEVTEHPIEGVFFQELEMDYLPIEGRPRPIERIERVDRVKADELEVIGVEDKPYYKFKKIWGKSKKLNNSFSVETKGAAFSVRKKGVDYDYFQICLQGGFSPHPELLNRRTLGLHAPVYVSSYTLDAYPVHLHIGEKGARKWLPIEDPRGLSRQIEDHQEQVQLIESAALKVVKIGKKSEPQSTEGKSTETNTSGLTISGNIGWPSGAVTTGLSLDLNRSVARVMEDVRVRNSSANNRHAYWNFFMLNLKGRGRKGNLISPGLFEPETKFIWEISHEAAIQCGLYNVVREIDEKGTKKQLLVSTATVNDLREDEPYYFAFRVRLDVGTRNTLKFVKTWTSKERIHKKIIDVLYYVKVPVSPQGDTVIERNK